MLIYKILRIERGTENIINVFRYFVLFFVFTLTFSGSFYVCYNYYVLAWILLIKESGLLI